MLTAQLESKMFSGPPGQWIFKTSVDTNQYCPSDPDEYKCKTWVAQQQQSLVYALRFQNLFMPPCPCFLWQASNMMFNPNFFRWDRSSCFRMTSPISFFGQYLFDKVCKSSNMYFDCNLYFIIIKTF